ncbi:toxin-antitoxin system YwqK family antitoxin [Fusobacterium sp.]|uniref:toxin-antitoxin system YwqK family antitoxin n=1 Tax=Fusobacterium sp. TaxID=68766 RepID=UPI000E97CC65|nr:toxin-antitoxin system YwqK family antitoxin [Fusobacterium sp.]HBJ78959.1 toxin-antitoxin system YwqK family antitoxin [Fusobacterium sp.]
MKKVIFILVILLLTSCYKKRIEDISKQEIRDGIVYVVNEDKPYSGVFIEKYEKDKFYVMQDKNGENKSYYKGGKVRKEITYKNGIKDGIEKIYYPNNQLMLEIAYKKGEKEGKLKNIIQMESCSMKFFIKMG